MTAINNLNLNAPTGPKSSGDTEYLSAGKNTSLMGTAMVTMDSIMLLFTELANSKFEQMSKKTEVSRDAQDMANRVDALLAGLASGKDTAALPPEVIEYMRANNIEVNGKSIDDFLRGAESLGSLWALNNLDSFDRRGFGWSSGMNDSANQVVKDLDAAGIKIDGQKASEWLANQKGSGSEPYSKETISQLVNSGRQLDKADLTAVKSALESHSGRASDFVQQNQLKLQQLMQNFNTAVTMANSVQSMNAESAKSIAQSIR
ncbi:MULTISPECIES: hypothetical protein [Winslowiella]|uniref:hypothetical protein n=1 Tax=Winslowiella TaxID=2997349 RepID=UPI0028BE8914|nr:hypothetical protein [Winslowiella toletana]WNN43884.1 hypothetical protein RIN69_19835 [Winslowiella toletana]